MDDDGQSDGGGDVGDFLGHVLSGVLVKFEPVRHTIKRTRQAITDMLMKRAKIPT